MPETLNDSTDEISLLAVTQVKKLICDETALASGAARKALRWFLFERAGDNTHEGSVGDALALLARAQSKDSLAAIITLRAMGRNGLMPDENATPKYACGYGQHHQSEQKQQVPAVNMLPQNRT